jgi:hypothetical protein
VTIRHDKLDITQKQARREQIELFITELESVGVVEKFDEELFRSLVEVMMVQVDGEVVVKFKDEGETIFFRRNYKDFRWFLIGYVIILG